jgi:5-hydroxyisourate hydrolase-like protein (transthyretin family)
MRKTLIPIALAVLVVTGCDRETKVTVHPVHGRVLYDGKPAAGVQVFLFPTSAPGVPDVPMNPHGVTDRDGNFTLGTYTDSDGAAEGGYQVVLFWPEETQNPDDETKRDRLLGWYTVARSRLSVVVPVGGLDMKPLQLPVMKVAPSESGGGVPGRN